MKNIVLDEAYRTIPIVDRGTTAEMTMIQAVVRSIAVNAAKGNTRSQRLFSQLVMTVERDNQAVQTEWLEVAMTYKIEWERVLKHREKYGVIKDDPVPHPDDIEINLDTGMVHINGPMTVKEKDMLAFMEEHKPGIEEEARTLRELLVHEEDPEERAEMKRELAASEEALGIIDAYLPE
jgi:hypothetical protein